ncbi:MAG: ABC transporter substrate-binding protein [Pseudotabrizicola sp.]|uniref:heme/hemin ABC transporter substrate-binding protein n=1 Tax=Pseudotabrizicola sp. TaxID=2939647 RepID=UPI00271B47DA|nr:ABC transporter substrate-binding protein [Pseudotabrizicola sp.]MDO8885182.1 ABC transporter substrate-binding protein [Pseudotabrizicola sp.]MDP2081413.1 ABC transporter substrate-binding protein [Pseudotabrizicola sp.]MDZ7572926.1 ABC transporter substrate-binding protein [Pseudotabrizicola sp.]
MNRARFVSVGGVHAGLTAMLLLLALATAARADDGPRRVIAAGGSAAEIVFALGQGDRLIARDTTSSFPQAVLDLPDVGYVRRLSPENLIAMEPDLILAEHDAGPPETIEILTRAGVPMVILPEARTPADVLAKIGLTAQALGLPEAGAQLLARTQSDLDAAAQAAASLPARPRVMFVLSLQGGRILAAGSDTSAAAMIALAGGVNAVEGFIGYKPLTDEAAIAAAPDVILAMDRGGDMAVEADELLAHPALALTPAAQRAQVVRMDGLYLLGFGPRTGAAALELNTALRAVIPAGRG